RPLQPGLYVLLPSGGPHSFPGPFVGREDDETSARGAALPGTRTAGYPAGRRRRGATAHGQASRGALSERRGRGGGFAGVAGNGGELGPRSASARVRRGARNGNGRRLSERF